MDARMKLAAAAAWIYNPKSGIAPYLQTALTMFVRRESSEIPTMALTKNGILLYNADFVQRTATPDLAAALLHETLHGVLHYHDRAAALGVQTPQDHQLANVAHDACINETLREMFATISHNLPSEWVYPETLEQAPKLVFEARYQLLKRKTQQPPKTKKQPGCGECGSCGGNPLPGEPAEGDTAGRSAADMSRMRRAVAQDVQARVKSRGFVPSELARWAGEELAPPKVDWRRYLRAVVRAAVAYRPGAIDLTWRAPSRRQAGLGYGAGVPTLPAMHAPKPRVGVLVDTSGSMGAAELTAALSEVQGVLKAVQAEIYLVTVDAVVHFAGKVSTIQNVRAQLKGGGGTVLTPGFDVLTKNKMDVVVACTDGAIGDSYPTHPPYKIVWCVIGGYEFEPSTGTVVRVQDQAS